MQYRLLLIFALPALVTALAQGGQNSEAARGTAVQNRSPLQPNAFNPLPLGSIHPRGWLRRQEELQAGGLTGHLDEFWSDVGPNSGWLGGSGESWERGPYYLDGLLPLAYQLDDSKLIAKAQRWVDWTLNSQTASGQFGPAKNDDWWPRMVMLKVLTQYEEVSGDPRVLPFMTKYFQYEFRTLPDRPLREWGKYRWQDNVYSVLWLYNRTGDADLLALAKLLHDQGYNWENQFKNFNYLVKQTKQSVGL
ncbi:MAG: beta-L-arabinofuranosidase domain-containing protein, partial [Bryobacteraceae bacterium]